MMQLITSNSSLIVNRCIRLMTLASIELLFNTDIPTYGLYLNITANSTSLWKSWAYTPSTTLQYLVPSVLW